MCELCKEIAVDDEEYENFIINGKEEFIFVDDGFNIFTDTGDSFLPGIVPNIKFCPKCGRKLDE